MACFSHISTQLKYKYIVPLLNFTWSDHCFCTENTGMPCFVCDFFECSLCSVRPSLIEYLSYNLNFLSVLVGPCSNYMDYIDFIEGRHISQRLRQHSGTCNGQNGYDKTPNPSPLVTSWMHMCLSLPLLILLCDTAWPGTIVKGGFKSVALF